MTSNNGGGLIVVAMVVGFVVALMGMNWVVEAVANLRVL
jgi:hypothetical protein